MPNPSASVSVLLVESDVRMSDAIRRQLEMQGHRVVFAEHGRAARQLLQHATFDLAVVEILPPDQGGLALIFEITTQQPSTPIIVTISGPADLAYWDAWTLRQLGIIHVLEKQWVKSTLLNVVENALRDKRRAGT